MKTEEESKDCIADELQPDRNLIDEDMMQDVNKNEGDDSDTEKRPTIDKGACDGSYK